MAREITPDLLAEFEAKQAELTDANLLAEFEAKERAASGPPKGEPWYKEAWSAFKNDLPAIAAMSDFDPVVGGSPVFRGETGGDYEARARESLPPNWQPSRMGTIAAQNFMDPRKQGGVPFDPVEPITQMEKIAGYAGAGGRVGLEFAPIAMGIGAPMAGVNLIPAASPYASAASQAAIRALATGGATFAAHTAATGGTPMEQLQSANTGMAVSSVPMLAGALPGFLGPLAQTFGGQQAVGIGTLYAMNKAEGMDDGEALTAAVGTHLGLAAGGGISHQGAGRGRQAAKPSKADLKAAELAKMRGAPVEPMGPYVEEGPRSFTARRPTEGMRLNPETGAIEVVARPEEVIPRPARDQQLLPPGGTTGAPSGLLRQVPPSSPEGLPTYEPSYDQIINVPPTEPPQVIQTPVRANTRAPGVESISAPPPFTESQARIEFAQRGEQPTTPVIGQQPTTATVLDASGRPVGAQQPAPEIVPPGYRRPAGEVTLGSGPLQAGYEALVNLKKRVRWNSGKWKAATDALMSDLPEHPTADIVRGYVLGSKDWKTTVAELAAREQNVKGVDSLPKPVKIGDKWSYTEDIRTKTLAELQKDVPPEVFDFIVGGGIRERDASGGATSPPQILSGHTGTIGDPYTMNQIAGGRMLERAVDTRLAEYAEIRDTLVEQTGVRSKGDREIAARLLNAYEPSMTDAQFLADPKVGDLLISSSVGPQKMFEFVKAARGMMDEARIDINEVAKAYGTKELGYLEDGYLPKYPARTRNPIEIAKRAAAGGQHTAGGNTSSDEMFNPSRRRRTGEDPEVIEVGGRNLPRNWDALDVLDSYMQGASRTVLGDVALANDMKIAKVLEMSGYENAAKDLENVANQRWKSSQWGFGGDAEAFMGRSKPTRVMREYLRWNKGQFDKTKYLGNPVFPLSTQWTSVIPTLIANPKAAAIVLARGDMINQAAREYAKAGYGATKKRHGGKPVDAVEGGKPVEAFRGRAAKAVEKSQDALVQAVEEWSMDFAALVARETTTGKRLGERFGERARETYADVDAGTTQAMFNKADREAVLNSQTVQGMFPAQGYSLSQFNRVREDIGMIGVDPKEVGISGKSAKATAIRRAAGVIGAAMVSSVLRQAMWQMFLNGSVDEEDIDLEKIALDAAVTAIPFGAVITGAGASGGASLPAGESKQINRGLASAVGDIKDGEADRETLSKAISPILSNFGGRGGVPASYVLRKWAADGSDDPVTQATSATSGRAPLATRPGRTTAQPTGDQNNGTADSRRRTLARRAN